MHERLVRYLKDNREHIVEHWLTETEIPAPPEKQGSGCDCTGVVPLAFFESAVNVVIQTVQHGKISEDYGSDVHLDAFLGITCSCKARCFGGRVCIELHDSGLKAFKSVFEQEWDTDQEFNALDRECCFDLINHALSGLFAIEIEHCKQKLLRNDCPFVFQKELGQQVQ